MKDSPEIYQHTRNAIYIPKMPRVKRPLAEADPNASRASANAKRAKHSDAKDLKTKGDDYESKGKAELLAILRKRNMPVTGNKMMLVQRLR